MPSHFIIKPVEIIKTERFVNQVVPVEGYISSIEFYDDMIFIKLKDQTGVLDLTILQENVKNFEKKLKKIKNFKTTKIYVEGLLQYFPSGIESERGYELIVHDLKIKNKANVFNQMMNTNTKSFCF